MTAKTCEHSFPCLRLKSISLLYFHSDLCPSVVFMFWLYSRVFILRHPLFVIFGLFLHFFVLLAPTDRFTDLPTNAHTTDRPTASCTRCSRLRSRSLITAAGRPIAQVAIPVIQSLDISPSPSGRRISSYIPKQTRKSRKRTRYHSAPFPPSPSPTPSGRHVNLNWVRCIWIIGSLGVWRLCERGG